MKRPSGGDIGTFGEGYSLAGGSIKVISARRVATEVRVWHETDIPTLLRDVRSQGPSGKHILALRFSGFDPKAALVFANNANSLLIVVQ
jgi:hypothetical protein